MALVPLPAASMEPTNTQNVTNRARIRESACHCREIIPLAKSCIEGTKMVIKKSTFDHIPN